MQAETQDPDYAARFCFQLLLLSDICYLLFVIGCMLFPTFPCCISPLSLDACAVPCHPYYRLTRVQSHDLNYFYVLLRIRAPCLSSAFEEISEVLEGASSQAKGFEATVARVQKGLPTYQAISQSYVRHICASRLQQTQCWDNFMSTQ
jgi:hypothetical protein